MLEKVAGKAESMAPCHWKFRGKKGHLKYFWLKGGKSHATGTCIVYGITAQMEA